MSDYYAPNATRALFPIYNQSPLHHRPASEFHPAARQMLFSFSRTAEPNCNFPEPNRVRLGPNMGLDKHKSDFL